jgi:alkylhydroperoxidase family enzyme
MFNSLKVGVINPLGWSPPTQLPSLVRRKLGKVIRPVEIMSENPDILVGYVKFMQTLVSQHRVDEKLKALARVRAAKVVECPFWIDINSAVGRDLGMSAEKLAEMNYFRESSLYSADEKLVLELAEAMSTTPARVSDELRSRLEARFDRAALIELAATIGWENYLARVNRVFGVESEEFYK